MSRAKFNLSRYHCFTGNMGRLLPIGLTEVIPGDTFDHATSLLVRMSPMAAPVMHPVTVRVHHFFVPHRLVWDDLEDFITAGSDGLQEPTLPQIDVPTVAKTAMEYYGVPAYTGAGTHQVSALPIRGMNKIFNEWYRDQDLVNARTDEDTSLAKIAWEKDYLTGARPWPQKGAAVTLPLGTEAPVLGIGKYNNSFSGTDQTLWESDGNQRVYDFQRRIMDGGGTDHEFYVEGSAAGGYPLIRADLSNATAATIAQLREALALQRFAEARARYGSRYTEFIRYIGVTPDDARIDRPEYLGGGQAQIQVSEVLQTTPVSGGNDYGVGDMYGHGISALRANRYRRFFKEHGYVHSFMSIRPKAMYMQGYERHWLKRYREEFFTRELQFIGQQEVFESEVFPDAANAHTTWGYQDRYDEYRSGRSYVSGDFRSTLDHWHLGRNFSSAQALNNDMVECDPSDRIFNVDSTVADTVWCAAQHRLIARRMVSPNSAPRIL